MSEQGLIQSFVVTDHPPAYRDDSVICRQRMVIDVYYDADKDPEPRKWDWVDMVDGCEIQVVDTEPPVPA